MNAVTTLSIRHSAQFSPVNDFTRFNRGMTCRARCWVCNTAWSRTGTAYVNLVLDTEGKQKFLCDACFSLYLKTVVNAST